jgi:ATP-dependent helicase/nuclease subunit A
MTELTPEQRRAVDRRDGSLLVRAGAGTGKTAVLVERFVRAVVEDGETVESILAITFTEKAAAEMRARVRRRFVELGRREEARAAEGALISTIHGFCSRVLRGHALSAGIDPQFRVLDELEAERLAVDAFDEALEAFMSGDLAEHVELVASYTPDRLRDMVRTAHSHLRSRGLRRPRLEEAQPPRPDDERALLEYGHHTMLRALLELYGDRYERLKRARSGLDFEDLELITRDLLAGDPGLREAYASRFAHVLVDEFQDTNPLQNELLELLARDNLFRVGDDNQSIYRFRNADVSVFRRHWEDATAAGRGETIGVNFRARGEVLEAIDLAFGRVWGDGFQPLREGPRARAGAPKLAPPVELLVVERQRRRWQERFDPAADHFGPAMHGAPPWRAVEARLLAKRVDELTREGPWSFGDVVLLFRATTAIGLFERALEQRGIPVHVVGGRGYWSQQQVADLRHWLSALANPLDELAVYSVLGSPLVGVSLDALALIGVQASRQRRDPLWLLEDELSAPTSDGRGGNEPHLAALLPEDDTRRLRSFLARFRSERRVAAQVSLETLIDRAVTLTGYDRHLLSLPGGNRRMANVRKLMRMARGYEAEEGRDLRGFIDSVSERDAIQTREGEAPLEAEALNAVRLMTIHRAKGLEFPVVCLADLGKDGRDDEGNLRISDDGTVGLRLARLGGGAMDSERLERIKAEQRAAAEEEERRIFYVACTRAKEHLVLSGATDLEKRHEPGQLCEPMRWVWRAFCAGLPSEGSSGEHVDAHEGREVRVRWTACTPGTVDELLPAADRAPARSQPPPVDEARAGFAQPELELAAAPAPRALPVSRLSYSGLEAYRRCGYRFYLERALGLSSVDPPHARDAVPEVGLPALLRGSLVHALLEGLDFRRPRMPSDGEVATLIEDHGVAPRPDDVAELQGMVERVLGSGLCERIGRARRVRTELPFAFTLAPGGAGGRSLLVNGVVDVLAAEDGGTLVVDWKSDPLEGRTPAELLADAYSTQRLIYALAGLRSGAERVEVAHCFLERPDEPAVAVYAAADGERLEAELLALTRGVVEASFAPASEPHYELCADCPGRAALCSWGPEQTLRAPP